MTATSLLRLRRLLARRGPAVAAVLLVVGAAALGGAWWIFAHPPTTDVTEYTNEQTIRSSVDTQAVVSGPTALYEQGVSLRNQPVYLQQTTPVVSLIHQTTVPDDQRVQVDQRIWLVIKGTHGGEVFWQSNRTLAQTTTTTQSGEVTTKAQLDIPELKERLADRETEIERAGSLQVSLRFRVDYKTQQYTGSFTKRAPLTIEEHWYVTPTPSTTRTRHTTVERTVTVPRDKSSYLVPGAAGILAIFLSLGVAGSWYYRLRDEDLTTLQHRIEQQVHADWISRGSLEEVNADRQIPVETLEDLVDVAIDTNTRVVHDPEYGIFAVVHDAAVYYHTQAIQEPQEEDVELFGQ